MPTPTTKVRPWRRGARAPGALHQALFRHDSAPAVTCIAVFGFTRQSTMLILHRSALQCSPTLLALQHLNDARDQALRLDWLFYQQIGCPGLQRWEMSRYENDLHVGSIVPQPSCKRHSIDRAGHPHVADDQIDGRVCPEHGQRLVAVACFEHVAKAGRPQTLGKINTDQNLVFHQQDLMRAVTLSSAPFGNSRRLAAKAAPVVRITVSMRTAASFMAADPVTAMVHAQCTGLLACDKASNHHTGCDDEPARSSCLGKLALYSLHAKRR